MHRAAVWTLLALMLMLSAPARAQLLSPGPLTRAHASLEGLRNCTQCHTLGQRGVDPDRCLSCHTPIRDRIRARRGLHGRQASRDCQSCHSDHHGRAFDPDRFNQQAFDHSRTGFALVGQHADATCRSCHRPALVTDAAVRRHVAPAGRLEETFLGVATECQTCHATDNPHSGALARADCASCHQPTDWNRVEGFDHAQTGTRLTGAHARAACSGCHGAEGRGAARFQNVPTACASCHASDSPHGTQFRGQTCGQCHTTAGWDDAPAFDHAATRFPLVGAHARTDCASCHGEGRAARFEGTTTSCQSCHGDDSPHGAQFAGRECNTCHGAATWNGAPNFNHARTDFPLVGQHATASCASCHEGGDNAQFAGVAHASCQSCHDDAHEGALGADCQTCHQPAGWTRIVGAGASALAERFNHEAATGFALVGAHAGADCASCHGDGRAVGGFARRDGDFHIPLASGAEADATFPALDGEACLSCHADPHGGAMADLPGDGDCATCHTQDGFAPATFTRARHDAETPFALTGAHAVVPCGACHTSGTDAAPSFGLGASCQSCHAADSPHGQQFAHEDGQTACADCHATEGWTGAEFDHTDRTGFALTGAHAVADCQSCHARPAEGPWTFAGLDASCASCHADDSPLGAGAANPHGDQFDGPDGRAACADCHDTDAFTLAHFDHERTRFPLAGAHAGVACASCHRAEPGPDGRAIVRFRPLPTACADCHSAGTGR